MFCCPCRRCRRRTALERLEPKRTASSIFLPPQGNATGRFCRLGRPASGIRPISRFPPMRGTHISSIWIPLLLRGFYRLMRLPLRIGERTPAAWTTEEFMRHACPCCAGRLHGRMQPFARKLRHLRGRTQHGCRIMLFLWRSNAILACVHGRNGRMKTSACAGRTLFPRGLNASARMWNFSPLFSSCFTGSGRRLRHMRQRMASKSSETCLSM